MLSSILMSIILQKTIPGMDIREIALWFEGVNLHPFLCIGLIILLHQSVENCSDAMLHCILS